MTQARGQWATAANVERLRKRWREGAPVGAIAAEFGVSHQCITRKAAQLGLAQRAGTGFWDDEAKVKELKQLWAGGKSAAQIKRELGAPSRNSVIGKVHRLGLEGRKNKTASVGRKPDAWKENRRVDRAARRPVKKRKASWRREAAVPPPITGLGYTILELTDACCRWPHGDGSGVRFGCEGKPIDGLPYCGYHARMAFRPAA